jgi:hypothetical protein
MALRLALECQFMRIVLGFLSGVLGMLAGWFGLAFLVAHALADGHFRRHRWTDYRCCVTTFQNCKASLRAK